jgi:hypothetical protein
MSARCVPLCDINHLLQVVCDGGAVQVAILAVRCSIEPYGARSIRPEGQVQVGNEIGTSEQCATSSSTRDHDPGVAELKIEKNCESNALNEGVNSCCCAIAISTCVVTPLLPSLKSQVPRPSAGEEPDALAISRDIIEQDASRDGSA